MNGQRAAALVNERQFIRASENEKSLFTRPVYFMQVCVQIPKDSDREVGNLMEIRDHYPKYVITLNEMDIGIENGIKIVHLADFLLAEIW